MGYTVKQVAAISGVSVRTLHFYHETGLLCPAYCAANSYRIYEEPQLLTLQQILFYRELGFELKHIKKILVKADFEKVAALQSHREVLEENVARMRSLLETIDKTVEHLMGTKKMKNEDMFVGFSVAAGKDRFDERLRPGGEPVDCKLSAKDIEARCVCLKLLPDGRDISIMTRTSGSTLSTVKWNLKLMKSGFALEAASQFSSRVRSHTYGALREMRRPESSMFTNPLERWKSSSAKSVASTHFPRESR